MSQTEKLEENSHKSASQPFLLQNVDMHCLQRFLGLKYVLSCKQRSASCVTSLSFLIVKSQRKINKRTSFI